MTAWSLKCTAANAAETVFWRRGARAAHGLLIDTLAVPLRFDEELAKAEAAPQARIEPEPATRQSRARHIVRLFAARDVKPR